MQTSNNRVLPSRKQDVDQYQKSWDTHGSAGNRTSCFALGIDTSSERLLHIGCKQACNMVNPNCTGRRPGPPNFLNLILTAGDHTLSMADGY